MLYQDIFASCPENIKKKTRKHIAGKNIGTLNAQPDGT
jgi:hypothetical protein